MTDHRTLTATRLRWTNMGKGASIGEQRVTVDGVEHLFAFSAVAPDDDPSKKRDWEVTVSTVVAGDLLRFTVKRPKTLRTDVATIATRSLADMVREKLAV